MEGADGSRAGGPPARFLIAWIKVAKLLPSTAFGSRRKLWFLCKDSRRSMQAVTMLDMASDFFRLQGRELT